MESKGQMPVADVARSYAQKFIKTSELRDQYLGYSLALQSYSKTGETHPDARFGDMLVELDSKDEVLNSIYQVSKATAKSLAWTADAILNIGTYPFRAVGALLTPEEGVGPVEHVWESLIGDPAGDLEPFKKIIDKAYPEYGEVNSVFFGNAGELLDKKLDQPVGLTPLLHLGPSVKTAKPATSFAEGLKTFGQWASIDMIAGWGVATSAGKIVASRQAKIAEFVAGLKKKKFAPIKIQAELTKKGIGGTQQKGIINKAGRFYTQLGLGIMERPGVYALDSALFSGGAGYFTSLWSESTADFGDQIIEMPWGADIRVTRSDEGLKLLGEFSAGAIVGLGPRFAAFSVSKLFHYIGMTAFEHRLVSKKTMKELQKIGIMPKDPIASGQELQVYKNLGKALRDQYTDYEIKEMIKGMRWVGQVLNKIDPDNVLNTSALVGVYMRSNFLRDLRSRTLPENSTYLFKKFTAKTKIVEEMTTALRAEEFQLSKLFTEAIKNSGKTPNPDAAVRLLTKLQKQYNKNIADISEKASKSSKKTNSMIKEFHDSLSVGEKENISKTIIKVKKELGDKFKLTEETIHQFKDNAAIVKLGDKVADEKIGNTILRKGSTADDIDQIGIDFDKVSLRPEFERLKDVRKAAYDSIPGFNNLKLKVNARNFIETNETAIKNIVGKRTGMEGVEYHKLDTLIERRANTINKYILENVTDYKNINKIENNKEFAKHLIEKITDEKIIERLGTTGGLRNEIPNIEIPLKVLQEYKSGIRQTSENIYKVNENASGALWAHHTELHKNIFPQLLGNNRDVKGVIEFGDVNTLIGTHAAPYSRGVGRKATKMTPEFDPALSGEKQIELFLTKTESRGIAENLELFEKLYPESSLMMNTKTGKLTISTERARATGEIRRQQAIDLIQQYWEINLKQKGVKKGIDDLHESFFTAGIGKHFSVDHGGKNYKGKDMYDFLKRKNIEVSTASKKATIEYLSFINEVDTAAALKLDKIGIKRQTKLSEVTQSLAGATGRGPAEGASLKLLKFIGFDPNAAGGSTKGLDELLAVLDKKEIKELQQVILDGAIMQSHGENMGMMKLMMKNSGLGLYANILPDMAVETRGLMTLFMSNEKAMIKLFGAKKAGDLVDMISLTFLLSTRGDLKHTLSFPTGLSINSMLARGFAYWRGVVGAKFLAADVGIRMMQKSGGKFLRALATSDDAIEAVTDLLLKGKYLPPRKQRIIFRHLIEATRMSGDEDLANEGEAAYQKGLHLFTFLSQKEIKEKNNLEFAEIGGDENGYKFMEDIDFIQEFATLKKGMLGKR